MKANIWVFYLFTLANALSLVKRTPATLVDKVDVSPREANVGETNGELYWKPKTQNPEYFYLLVDEICGTENAPNDVTATSNCPFANYTVRLVNGAVKAEPYNIYSVPPLETFFLDDDSYLYAVSEKPLQLRVDLETGVLRYSSVDLGWQFMNELLSFSKTGNKSTSKVDSTLDYLVWPRDQTSEAVPWNICLMNGNNGYVVYVKLENQMPEGVKWCIPSRLAAINYNQFLGGGKKLK